MSRPLKRGMYIYRVSRAKDHSPDPCIAAHRFPPVQVHHQSSIITNHRYVNFTYLAFGNRRESLTLPFPGRGHGVKHCRLSRPQSGVISRPTNLAATTVGEIHRGEGGRAETAEILKEDFYIRARDGYRRLRIENRGLVIEDG